MNRLEPIIIPARFDEGDRWGHRLKLKGPLNREIINLVIQRYTPHTFSPKNEYHNGEASFIVDSEVQALKLAKELDEKMEKYGFRIRYDEHKL